MTDPDHIHNWHRLDHRLTTSGQPTEVELAELAALGVRHVVNLAPHDHAKALPDEAASVARLGMRYTNIPVDFRHPGEDDFRKFSALMADLGETPVHVHCAANYRVSAFLYRYRREVLGVPEAAAAADLDAVWRPDDVWSAFIARPRAPGSKAS